MFKLFVLFVLALLSFNVEAIVENRIFLPNRLSKDANDGNDGENSNVLTFVLGFLAVVAAILVWLSHSNNYLKKIIINDWFFFK